MGPLGQQPKTITVKYEDSLTIIGRTSKCSASRFHGLFLKLHNLANRQDAKVAKTNKFDVSACEETTSGKLGGLGVLAVKNAAYVVLQEKTMLALLRASSEAGGGILA